MADDDTNSLGGRITLAAVGGIVLLIGVIPLYFTISSGTGAGLENYAMGIVLSLAGIVLLVVATVNPDALDIGTRVRPSEAEKYERRVEDPTEDE